LYLPPAQAMGASVASVAVVALSAGEDLVLGRAVVPGGTGVGVGFEARGVALVAVGAVKAGGNAVFASVGLVAASGAGRGVGRACGTVTAYRHTAPVTPSTGCGDCCRVYAVVSCCAVAVFQNQMSRPVCRAILPRRSTGTASKSPVGSSTQ